MKTPSDTIIKQENIRFQNSGGLPFDAVLWGATIQGNSEERNSAILARVKSIEESSPPASAIRMDGRVTDDKKTISSHDVLALQETPFAAFADNFRQGLKELSARVTRYYDIIRMIESTESRESRRVLSLDLFTYQDMIFIQLAAMCVENEKNHDNYTIQVLLKRQEHADLAKPFDDILKRQICVDCDGNPVTVKKGLKVLRDKFLCHRDNFEDYDIHGNDGLGEGRWTPGDRVVLSHLLLPPKICDGKTIPPAVELVAMMEVIDRQSTEMGVKELIQGVFDKSRDMCQGKKDSGVRMVSDPASVAN